MFKKGWSFLFRSLFFRKGDEYFRRFKRGTGVWAREKGNLGKPKYVRSSRATCDRRRTLRTYSVERLWAGDKEAQSCHVLRQSKTSGRKGDLVEQAGRKKTKKQVIQVRRISRLWDRMLVEGKVTGEKIVLRGL